MTDIAAWHRLCDEEDVRLKEMQNLLDQIRRSLADAQREAKDIQRLVKDIKQTEVLPWFLVPRQLASAET